MIVMMDGDDYDNHGEITCRIGIGEGGFLFPSPLPRPLSIHAMPEKETFPQMFNPCQKYSTLDPPHRLFPKLVLNPFPLTKNILNPTLFLPGAEAHGPVDQVEHLKQKLNILERFSSILSF